MENKNAINAIEVKCRELGIYDEIFKDEDLNIIDENKNYVKINKNLLKRIKTIAADYGMDCDSFIEATMLKEIRK